MKHLFHGAYAAFLARLVFLASDAHAANVNPGTGYTNDFGTHPPADDWVTWNAPGTSGSNYDLDSDVNTNITASGVSARTLADPNNPPLASSNAVWSSTGLYLQTRPTLNRYTALIGKFVNATGTNATQITLSYLFTIPSAGASEDSGKGTRVYYSLTGETNSWINLPALNNISSGGGIASLTTNLALQWTNGGSLYLLWADDNAGAGTDVPNQIDDFSLQVTAGSRALIDFTCLLNGPTNDAVFVSGTSIIASAVVVNGTPPYTVEYFTNSGMGTVFQSAGSSATAPYEVSLGSLSTGTYTIYAVANDQANTPLSTHSTTNMFSVVDPLALTLTAPVDGATFDNLTDVVATAMVSGGTAPYFVQFYLDDVAHGPPASATPYERNLGALFVGDHTIRATVRDAKGWTNSSLVNTVHITGPLAATLIPTNGASYNYGQSVALTAAAGGGTAPYRVTFYTNDQPLGSIPTPPFTTNLGVLSVGSYTSYVHITDSSSPTAHEANSSTNVFTILPNPLVVNLTQPTNGQRILAGQAALTLAATATVNGPLTVTDVEFFYDGFSAGLDNTPPFSSLVANPSAGSHTVHAAATDSLGRKSYSVTNQIMVTVSPPGSNDDFANAIPLSGSVVTTGNNLNATQEFLEPNHAGVFGGASVWWTWTATASGLTVIDTSGSDFDTLLAVYTGTAINQLTTIAADDDSGDGAASRVEFNAVAGTAYLVAVDGFFGNRGNIVLHIQGVSELSIDTPTNGMVFTFGDPIPVIVGIGTNFPNLPVTRVDFYVRGSLFASSTNAPFSAVATNLPAGTNAFYVIAFDSLGMTRQSPVVSAFVQTIGVTLLTPSDGATFLNTSPITVSASAYLPSGSITNVEFFVDARIFGQDATPPFRATWFNVTSGSHRLTAVGQSDTGVRYHSQPVHIGVAAPIVPFGAVWKYLDNGSNQGTNWIAPTFDDRGWTNGPAELGYGQGDEATVVQDNATPGYNPADTDRYITTYFRHSFVLSNAAGFTGLALALERDDVGLVYLNGREILRSPNLPPAPTPIDYLTTPTFAVGGDTIDTVTLSLTNLVVGTNVLAAEIHQFSARSSDISFNLELAGLPTIIRNLSPLVVLANPTNGAYFLAPGSVTLEAIASDPDGTVAKVEFFADGVKLGETTNAPYTFVWNNPPVAARVLTAVVTDDGGATTTSDDARIVVYDALGSPVAVVTSPANGAIMEGPTNLVVTATVTAITSVTNMLLLANGVEFGSDDTPPYVALWDPPFGTNLLSAVAVDVNGLRGTSQPVTVIITIPPTNTVAPTIATEFPLAGSTVTNLTSITVTFSEYVQNIDAADLLINGLPATDVNASHSRSNYTFTFPRPSLGRISVAWAAGHGITDYGWPSVLPFDQTGSGATWFYDLVDRTPPTIVARTPVATTTVNSLQQVLVTFSEAVTGVDAADLIVAGTPAYEVSGNGASYTFLVSQPASGTILVTWATNHGIFDLSEPPNAFIRTNVGAAWSFALDARRIFVESYATWRFVKGTNEASIPTQAWRQLNFDDAGWSNSLAPFLFGEPAFTNAAVPGTDLSDMANNAYGSIYLRKQFTVGNASGISTLLFNRQSDDGFIAWINGFEVFRYNMPSGEIPYSGSALTAATEPGNNGVPFVQASLTNPGRYLVNGTNVLAVHAFNVVPSSPEDDDFVFNAQLYTFATDIGLTVPSVTQVLPGQGNVLFLTNITVTFTEGVTNVDAGDLLVNGVPANTVSSSTNRSYSFSFAQPDYGPVIINWATNHGIVDFDAPPKPFNGNVASSILRYTLINPSGPRIATQAPLAGSTVTGLTSITVTFTEPVSGVDHLDLLISGAPAASVSTGDQITYSFTFPQPSFGSVSVRWASNHFIVDQEAANPFDPTPFNGEWDYTLVNPSRTVVRGPYLQIGTHTGGLVRWRTDLDSDAVVFYGTNPESLTNVATGNIITNEHMVQISGLEPETRYFYSIGSSSQRLASGTNYWFVTSPVPGTRKPTRIWVLGDAGTAGYSSPDRQISTRNAFYNFAATNGAADLWLLLGDNAYNSGTDAEYQLAMFDMYPATLRNLFLWPALGNHETSQSTTAEEFPYLDIFSLPRNGEAGGIASGSEKYYSFDYANIHFVCLDSMTSGRDTNTAMAQWLNDDLAATTQEWIIVYFHHPPYTRGSHNSDVEGDLVQIRQNLVPIMEAHGVDLVLSGHSHCWERSFLLHGHYGFSSTLSDSMKIDSGDGRDDGTGAYRKNAMQEGVVYTVAGSAGQATGGQLNHPAHFRSLNELGTMVIDVAGNRLDAIFLDASGQSRDYFTLVKRPSVAAPTGLMARAISPSQIELTWSDVANELGYVIERSLNGTNFVQIATLGVDATSVRIGGLLANTTYFYRVRAFDANGESDNSTVVNAVTGNSPPALAPIPDVIAEVLSFITVTNRAHDPDLPSVLRYSLGTGGPAGVRLDTTNGILRWIPNRDQAPSTNVITVRVTDDGTPPLSDAKTFTVVVKDYVEVQIGSAVMRDGDQASVPISFFSSAELTNLTCSLLLSRHRFSALMLENLVPALSVMTMDLTPVDGALLSVAALPGQTLSGFQPLARLHLTAASGQSSAFIPLQLSGAVVARAQPGLSPTILLQSGRATVIGVQPLIEADVDELTGTRSLTVYGIAGRTYMLEHSMNSEIAVSWQPLQPLTLNNLWHSMDVSQNTNSPGVFFRVRE